MRSNSLYILNGNYKLEKKPVVKIFFPSIRSKFQNIIDNNFLRIDNGILALSWVKKVVVFKSLQSIFWPFKL